MWGHTMRSDFARSGRVKVRSAVSTYIGIRTKEKDHGDVLDTQSVSEEFSKPDSRVASRRLNRSPSRTSIALEAGKLC